MREQLSRFLYWVKGRLHIVDVLGVGMWVYAWTQNAGGGHFDLDKFWQMFLTVRGVILAQFGIDSKFNSEPGKPPAGGNNADKK